MLQNKNELCDDFDQRDLMSEEQKEHNLPNQSCRNKEKESELSNESLKTQDVLAKDGDAYKEKALEALTQRHVKITVLSKKGRIYGELNRNNAEHLKGMLIQGDGLDIVDEQTEWQARVCVKGVPNTKRIYVDFTRKAQDLNRLSKFTVKPVNFREPGQQTRQGPRKSVSTQVKTVAMLRKTTTDFIQSNKCQEPTDRSADTPDLLSQAQSSSKKQSPHEMALQNTKGINQEHNSVSSFSKQYYSSNDLLIPTKVEYKSAEQYTSTLRSLIETEKESQQQYCEELTQLNVKITLFEADETLYCDLDRSNEDHYKDTLKVGDTLVLIDERTEWQTEAYVERAASQERVRLSLSSGGKSLNSQSTSTVKTVFIDVPYKRTIEGLYEFANGNKISKDLKSIILGQAKYSTNEVSLKSTVQYDLTNDTSLIDASSLNEFQREAAVKALGSSPLVLIQGPPGTGKTTTMTATILQFVKNIKKHHKILVCAPPNLAVDNLTEALIKHGLGDSITRIYAVSRQSSERKPELNAVALHNIIQENASQELKLLQLKKKGFNRLPKKELLKLKKLQLASESKVLDYKKIVCCTYVTARNPTLSGHFFKYVFIDEAAQATELECLLPMLHHAEKVVLAGDHKQIGPFVRNKSAQAAGLDHTMFERLMPKADSCMLQWQYRMHHMISEFPSRRFYHAS